MRNNTAARCLAFLAIVLGVVGSPALAEPYARLIPVDPREYNLPAYGDGVRIVGSTIYLEPGRDHRVWLEARFGRWFDLDPNLGGPRLAYIHVGIHAPSLSNAVGADLLPATLNCAGDHEVCRNWFGDWGPGNDFGCWEAAGTSCMNSFVQCCRFDWLHQLFYECQQTANSWFCVGENSSSLSVYDDDREHYAGTFVIDVPATAMGVYTVELDDAQTYLGTIGPADSELTNTLPATIVVSPGVEHAPPNRYLAVVPGSLGPPGDGDRYIRLEIIDCPQYPASVGQVVWVQTPADYPEVGGQGTFRGATTGCVPTPTSWTGPADPEVLHVFGHDIVPGAEYEIRVGPQACGDLTCMPQRAFARTGIWADVAPPFTGGTDFLDIAAIVDAYRALASAMSKTRTQLAGETVNPNSPISFLDISASVDAYRGWLYPWSGPQGCP